MICINHVTDSSDFFVSQISATCVRIYVCCIKDTIGTYSTDTIDVYKRQSKGLSSSDMQILKRNLDIQILMDAINKTLEDKDAAKQSA